MGLDADELRSLGAFAAAMQVHPWRTEAELRVALERATAGLPLAHLGAIVAAAEALRGVRLAREHGAP